MIADARGITIIEVLIAVAVIGVGIVGVMSVVPVASYSAHEGGALSSATFLAEQKMEELRGATWQVTPANDCLGLSAGNGNVAPTSTTCTRTVPTVCNASASCPISPDEANVPGHAGFARTVRVANCSTVPGGCGGVANANMRQVTVTVAYRPITGAGAAAPGATKTVTLRLDVSRR